MDDEKTVEKDVRLGCGKDFARLESGICGAQGLPQRPSDGSDGPESSVEFLGRREKDDGAKGP